ncbi:carboxymuconolactone decarboxylase family protein [Scardovia wiggsiae]|uniref:carboxymuconolactone decarboxylase family protein n=1 Tax=Scardovia wiggsiae TaxID=230143 RepID=UPI003BA897E5
MAKIVQTAGRDNLGDFAPQFAHFNDEVLFGEEWNNEDITAKTRSIITISVFMGRGLVDSSLKAHLQIGRKNGITKKEITALITHAAFYAGWPVAWAVFNMAKEIWADDSGEADNRTPELNEYAKTIFFPVGEPNDAYAQYFDGNSYLAPIEAEGVAISNVTFEPGCRNHWHIHRAS